MKFDIGPREAAFGTFNNRAEFNGDDRVKAIDLPVTTGLSMKELDMVIPTQGQKASEFLFDAKGNPLTFVLWPLKVNRKPENVSAEIAYGEGRKKKFTIGECRVKDPTIELDDKNRPQLKFKLQISNVSTKDLDTIVDNIENGTCRIKLRSKAPELPLEPEEGTGAAAGENDKDDE